MGVSRGQAVLKAGQGEKEGKGLLNSGREEAAPPSQGVWLSGSRPGTGVWVVQM